MDSSLKNQVDVIINGMPYYMSSTNYDPLQYQFNYSTSFPNTNLGPIGATNPNVTIPNGATWTVTPVTTSAQKSSIKVSGDAEIDGDIIWQGRSVKEMFNKIEQRLAIVLSPDPKKLEQFKALKKAYDHYKIL